MSAPGDFGRIWAAQDAQPLGSRWHFHISHQNAKFFNGFLPRSSTAGMARKGWKGAEETGMNGTGRDQGLLIPVPRHPKAGLGCSREEGTVKGRPDSCSFQRQFPLLPIASDTAPLSGASGRLQWVIMGAL